MTSVSQEILLDTLAVAAALLYLLVGVLQARRPVPAPSRDALWAFVVWWVGLGLLSLLRVLLGRFGTAWLGLEGAVALRYVELGITSIVLAGLLYYLLFVYTGRPWTKHLAIGFYAILLAATVGYLEAQDPVGFTEDGQIDYANEYGTDHPFTVSLALALIAPPLLAALAYFLLFFRVEDRTARYRVVLVSGGIVLWFGFHAVSRLLQATVAVEPGFGTRLAGQVLGLVAAALVLVAYLPPRWLQEALGIRPVTEGSGRAADPPRRRASSYSSSSGPGWNPIGISGSSGPSSKS